MKRVCLFELFNALILGQTNSIHDSVTDQSQLNHRIIFGSDTGKLILFIYLQESESSDVLPFRQHQSKHTSSEEEDDNASPNVLRLLSHC